MANSLFRRHFYPISFIKVFGDAHPKDHPVGFFHIMALCQKIPDKNPYASKTPLRRTTPIRKVTSKTRLHIWVRCVYSRKYTHKKFIPQILTYVYADSILYIYPINIYLQILYQSSIYM